MSYLDTAAKTYGYTAGWNREVCQKESATVPDHTIALRKSIIGILTDTFRISGSPTIRFQAME